MKTACGSPGGVCTIWEGLRQVNWCVEKRGSSRASQIERNAWLNRSKRPGETLAEEVRMRELTTAL
jgi:hypothetical protein